MTVNRQWRVSKTIEHGEPLSVDQFQWCQEPLRSLDAEEALLRTLCLGTSPAQRGYITNKPSMHEKVTVGQVMRGRGVSVVVDSRSQQLEVGDIVVSTTGWQDYSIHNPLVDSDLFGLRKLNSPTKPYALALGVLGSAGLTAYFGLTDVASVISGQVLVISAAAGGVGSCAVQIGKKLGCKVIGIAGGKRKCQWVVETLGADHAIDYKSMDLDRELSRLCPNGVDVFFDNVGGQQLNTVLTHLSIGARVAICGFISTDYSPTPTGPKNYVYLLKRRATMKGFFIFDFAAKFEEAETVLRSWYESGHLTDTNDIVEGLEHMPSALASLFTGDNLGVRLCRVTQDP